MTTRMTTLWIVGLLTLVPYSIYHLLFQAQRDEYALLITFVLFWIFGFWGVVSPILATIRIRKVLRSLEMVRSKQGLLEILQSPDGQEAAIDQIALENRIPKFLARRIYFWAVKKLSDADAHARDR